MGSAFAATLTMSVSLLVISEHPEFRSRNLLALDAPWFQFDQEEYAKCKGKSMSSLWPAGPICAGEYCQSLIKGFRFSDRGCRSCFKVFCKKSLCLPGSEYDVIMNDKKNHRVCCPCWRMILHSKIDTNKRLREAKDNRDKAIDQAFDFDEYREMIQKAKDGYDQAVKSF